MNRRVTILGARSDIAMACAHAFAAAGDDLTLCARQSETLAEAAQDLELRHGGSVTLRELDVLDVDPQAFADDGDLPDVVICAVGVLGDQLLDQDNAAAIRSVLRANFEAPA
ncbi:MAG: SDR family NAD(P)-dependent oxidoreductase, partial [Pseudomonadota bacterium]|nr:SDR family NAD(P)-dependent oxidoreductase [Pseudomonadota bacterium]